MISIRNILLNFILNRYILDATIVLACRDVIKGLDTKVEIIKKLGYSNFKIYVRHLDLCSIASIVKFAKNLSQDFTELYALVNNAGVFYHPQGLTEDGFEVTLQTNYLGKQAMILYICIIFLLFDFLLGHFILTHHLFKLLHKSVHARIINTSSEAHRIVNAYDLKAVIQCQTECRNHFVAYGASKLALTLFTRELGKRLSSKLNKVLFL